MLYFTKRNEEINKARNLITKTIIIQHKDVVNKHYHRNAASGAVGLFQDSRQLQYHRQAQGEVIALGSRPAWCRVHSCHFHPGMDGINGITTGYSLAVNGVWSKIQGDFDEQSMLIVLLLVVLGICFFNFRPKGKAKCFVGDVRRNGIAFIMLFAIGSLITKTGDVTWLVFLLLMVSLIPNTVLAHCIYLIVLLSLLVLSYLLFMKKYYHLHEEYLNGIESN